MYPRGVATIRRLAIDVSCPGCSRSNELLLPEASCGNEFVWNGRCGSCGGWGWFHSRQDREFVRAIKEASVRRSEPGGLSPEGTKEAHAAYEATLDPCPCGGRFHVVLDLDGEGCVGCGQAMKEALRSPGEARNIDVQSLRKE